MCLLADDYFHWVPKKFPGVLNKLQCNQHMLSDIWQESPFSSPVSCSEMLQETTSHMQIGWMFVQGTCYMYGMM